MSAATSSVMSLMVDVVTEKRPMTTIQEGNITVVAYVPRSSRKLERLQASCQVGSLRYTNFLIFTQLKTNVIIHFHYHVQCHVQRTHSIIRTRKSPHFATLPTNHKLIFVEDAELAGKGSNIPARDGREAREETQHLPAGEFFVHIRHGRPPPQDGRSEYFTQVKGPYVIHYERKKTLVNMYIMISYRNCILRSEVTPCNVVAAAWKTGRTCQFTYILLINGLSLVYCWAAFPTLCHLRNGESIWCSAR